MTTAMRDVPINDRPRERLLRQGVAALSDAELVAVQLGSGHTGASALDVARRLLATWGGVSGLARAQPEELVRTPGVGLAKAARLAASFGMASRMNETDDGEVRLTSSADIAREGARVIGTSRSERVVILVTNGRLRLLHSEVVAVGSATGCPVPIREILASVLRHDGAAFAVAHNHPSGDPRPSAADHETTEVLRAAAQATGLRFLDHVVVAGGVWRSASL